MIFGGLLCWAAIFWPVWSPRCRRMRRGISVSRNLNRETAQIAVSNATQIADNLDADLATWGVGPAWQQDAPFPELFDDEES